LNKLLLFSVGSSTPQSKPMASAAVSQNLNELDNLLQDLSNARQD
jgi:hypothetical protein